ncbi:RRP12-like protein-like protein [Corchorus olitorius]|uniref:RRP12-like protein-like protein n=1 Tax=Corchorus olitorius TaxID=93759 RepID=A0A1R3HM59_9ROSI|nr:RRP12-like protein-like protein [Corchorus olitorius]
MENIIISLASYVSGEKNPVDTLISAATLLKCAVDKLHAGESNLWMKNVPLVSSSSAVLLTSEATASQASAILKELISHHIELKSYSADNDGIGNEEADAIKSICAVFENTLNSTDGIPNEHVLAVLATLFQKLDKLQLVDDEGEFEKQAGNANVLMEKGGNTSTMEKGARRYVADFSSGI